MKAKSRFLPESSLVDADTHVESFRQTRHNRRTELVEDYVELIADLLAVIPDQRHVLIARIVAEASIARFGPIVAAAFRRLAVWQICFARKEFSEDDVRPIELSFMRAYRRCSEKMSGMRTRRVDLSRLRYRES